VLGWPSPHSFSQNRAFYDESGSRRIPSFPLTSRNRACVSLYGDSYTEGVGVSHQEAWSNVLSELLGCRVANYGVAGYGSDQAYLRYSHNRNDKAAIVILSHMTQNIARNVNQLRNFIAPNSCCGLKPRFILNSRGELELVPIPKLAEKEYNDLEYHPGLYLKHDFFIPGGLSGTKFASFPYIVSLIKASNIIVQRVISDPCYWRELYNPEHQARALQVTVAVMENFYKEARVRRQYPIIFILPTQGDLKYYKLHNHPYYQPLIDILKSQNIEVVDIAARITQRWPNIDLAMLFSQKSHYHYSPWGNRILAEVAAAYLREQKLAGVPGRPDCLRKQRPQINRAAGAGR
jgi:hypothetical protein